MAGINWVRKKVTDFRMDGSIHFTFGHKESNELYVAGEAGVFVTKDGGEKWKRFW